MSLFWLNFLRGFHFLENKIQIPYYGQKGPAWWFLSSSSHPPSVAHSYSVFLSSPWGNRSLSSSQAFIIVPGLLCCFGICSLVLAYPQPWIKKQRPHTQRFSLTTFLKSLFPFLSFSSPRVFHLSTNNSLKLSWFFCISSSVNMILFPPPS